MKMKRTTTIMMLLASVMVVLAGCQEPLDTTKGSGMKIKISSMSSDLSTKTAYSGAITNGRERIDWKEGDKVRIFSEDITLVANATGMNAGGGYNYATGEAKYYHDYTIASNGTPREEKSDSSLQDEGEGVGLVWVNDPTATATVYGIYPTGESIRTSDNRLRGFSGLTITPPALAWTSRSETVTVGGSSVARSAKIGTPTDAYMQAAYMVAAPTKFVNQKDEDTGISFPTVNLEFYPIFNAFEFELYGEKDNPITINSLTLSSTTSYLTGDYAFDYRNKNDVQPTYWNNGPLVGGVDLNSGDAAGRSQEVTVSFPSGTVISANDTVRFTILTLPPADGSPLTNLTLTVNYGNSGNTKTKSLKLNNQVSTSNPQGNPISFPAFHKARIKGLAMEGDVWQLNIMTEVNDWTLVSKETSFINQVGFRSYQTTDGARNVLISGMTETGNHEMPNDVPETDPSYYARYYQIRTLDMSVDDPHFVVKFMPTSPIGGYWMLSPEGIGGSLQYFDIKVYLGEGIYSDELIGQIMGTEVEIHIFPSADFDPNAGESYAMIMKCFFSSQLSFDDPYSADSEFQDVHGDGRYSYWRFTLPSNN